MAVTQTGAPVMMDPSVILLDPTSNGRFGLKPERVKRTAENILEMGGILQPIEVTALNPPVDGKTHKAIFGNYRVAAALTPECMAAGVKVPVMIKPAMDILESLKRNTAENMERENQTPMDAAVAIRKLLDAGMSKIEVRKLYARPGRKGPASNSWVNIVLSFLELPKPIQNKIHNNGISFDAAAIIAKASPEKRQAIIDKIEADRAAAAAREEKDEEKLLAAEAREEKIAEEHKKAVEAAEALTTERDAALTKANEELQAAQEALAKTTQAVSTDRAAAKEVPLRAKEVDAATKKVEKLVAKYSKVDEVVTEKKQSAAAHAQERAKKLKEARELAEKAKAKTAKPVSKGEAAKAAKSVGATTSYVALKAGEMREVVHGLAIGGNPPKIMEVFSLVERCFSGEITDKQLDKSLNALKFLK